MPNLPVDVRSRSVAFSMENFYERISELLGKHKNDLVFNKFVEDLGDQPRIYLENDHSTEYAFERSGLFLSFFSRANCFGHVFFKSGTADGKKSRYPGNFPAGIEFGDHLADVHRKLCLNPSPLDQDPETYEYKLDNLLLRFYFELETGKLKTVIARYIPAWDLVNNRPKGY